MVGHVRVAGIMGRISASEVGVEVGAAVEGLSSVGAFVGALVRDENKFVDSDQLVGEEVVVSFPPCHDTCE